MKDTRRYQKRVLVTDGNNRAALAITRSLGRHQYTVFVASESESSLAGASKYCQKCFTYTNPDFNSIQFQEDILEIVRLQKIDILIPAAETTTLQCLKLKDKLQHECKLPFQKFTAVDLAASKLEVLKIAQELNIPIPDTYFMETKKDIREAFAFCKKQQYPIVIKTSRSRLENNNKNINLRAQYASNEKDVFEIIDQYPDEAFPILIQKRINGPGVGLFACLDNGYPIATFSHKRIREKPPSGGVSVLRKSYPINPTIRKNAINLLTKIKWSGVAMVEFKKDEKSDDFKLMEINGRFWGSLQLAIDAGVDFPYIVAQIAEGKRVMPIQSYRLNVKTRWLMGDIDALLSIIFKNRKNLSLPPQFPSKWRYIIEFFKFDLKRENFEVLKGSDPGPFFHELRQWFKVLSRKQS